MFFIAMQKSKSENLLNPNVGLSPKYLKKIELGNLGYYADLSELNISPQSSSSSARQL